LEYTQSPGETFLENRIALDDLATLLTPREDWHPFPRWSERAAWEAVPPELADSVRERAAELADWQWPHIPATLFLEYARIGNRINYEEVHFERRRNLISLVLGECLTGEGRYLDQIINGLWAIFEESFWGLPAHNRPRFYQGSGLPDVDDPYVDLFAAETGNLVAWTIYLLGDRISKELPIVTDRAIRELQHRILEPYRARNDWVWLGFEEGNRAHPNNWNPWIHSNVLTVNLLFEPDPEVRVATVAKCIRGIDRFLGGYHADGGCDEGISYWGRAGASLFDCLDVLESASDGRITLWDQPLIQEIGRYVYRMHIGGQWFVNFADGSAKADVDGNLIYRYGTRIGDDRMAALGVEARTSFVRAQPARIVSLGRSLNELLDPTPTEPQDARTFVRDAWLPGLQVLTAHASGDSNEGLFLAVKGGHNAESHNHNDVGSIVVGYRGVPVIIDAGVETYSRKTFSDQRYEIWTMQSGYHNLPTINGQDQLPGIAFAARDAEVAIRDDASWMRLDIAGAWGADAGVVSWQRTATIDRLTREAQVEDTWDLERVDGGLTWNLMLAEEPELTSPGSVLARHGEARLAIVFDASQLTPSVERVPITDGRLGGVWGEAVYRLRLTHVSPSPHGTIALRFVPAG
jgi:hypothetical protein